MTSLCKALILLMNAACPLLRWCINECANIGVLQLREKRIIQVDGLWDSALSYLFLRPLLDATPFDATIIQIIYNPLDLVWYQRYVCDNIMVLSGGEILYGQFRYSLHTWQVIAHFYPCPCIRMNSSYFPHLNLLIVYVQARSRAWLTNIHGCAIDVDSSLLSWTQNMKLLIRKAEVICYMDFTHHPLFQGHYAEY